MRKSVLVFFVLFISLSSGLIFAQDNNSLQFNGGVIYPRRSSNGLSTSVQYNYSLNSKINLYFSAGYSSWDRFYVMFHEELNGVQRQEYFKTYNADNHSLIPLNVGAKINFHTNKFFTSFVNFEIGYVHLSYDSYSNIRVFNHITGEVTSYTIDGSTKKEISKNLFNVGIGTGISHPLNRSLDLILSFKISTNFNGRGFGFLSTKGTYSVWSVGVNVKI